MISLTLMVNLERHRFCPAICHELTRLSSDAVLFKIMNTISTKCGPVLQ